MQGARNGNAASRMPGSAIEADDEPKKNQRIRASKLTTTRGILAGVGAAAVLLAMPFVIDEYPLTLATDVAIFTLFVLGINLLLGYTGLISLGHSIFLGLGGYGIGIFVKIAGLPLWLAVILTLCVIAIVAFAMSLVCTRTAGVEFLLITLAFSQMIYGAAVKMRITGGDDGMPGLPRPDLSGIGLDSYNSSVFYFYILTIVLLALALVWRLINSPFGSVLIGIRENERRMIALGYNVTVYKIVAFVISGIISGTAGILLAQKLSFVNPDSLAWQVSGEGLLMAIIGGPQSFLGPIVGAAFFVIVKERLAGITQEYMIFFGLFFMLIVAVFRNGLAGFVEMLVRRKVR